MTLKYLYVLCPDKVEDNFNNLHIPIDNYVFSVAQKEFDIKYPKKPWADGKVMMIIWNIKRQLEVI